MGLILGENFLDLGNLKKWAMSMFLKYHLNFLEKYRMHMVAYLNNLNLETVDMNRRELHHRERNWLLDVSVVLMFLVKV